MHSSAPLKISNDTSSDQNIQKHAEILGSKVTNHRVKKFQCESYTLNSQEKAWPYVDNNVKIFLAMLSKFEYGIKYLGENSINPNSLFSS